MSVTPTVNGEVIDRVFEYGERFIKILPLIPPLIQGVVTAASAVNKLIPPNIDTFVREAQSGNSNAVRKMLESNPEIIDCCDSRGWTALAVAAQDGRIGVIDLLLEKGASVNKRTDTYGRSALMQASRNGHLAIVSALLAKNADANLMDRDGWTALMLATWQGHREIVTALLSKNADKNLRNQEGDRAAIIAQKYFQHHIVQLVM